MDKPVCLFLGCIECMRCRLLLPMSAVSVCQSVRPSVCLPRVWTRRRLQCVLGHSVQSLPNYFSLLLIHWRKRWQTSITLRRRIIQTLRTPTDFYVLYIFCSYSSLVAQLSAPAGAGRSNYGDKLATESYNVIHEGASTKNFLLILTVGLTGYHQTYFRYENENKNENDCFSFYKKNYN